MNYITAMSTLSCAISLVFIQWRLYEIAELLSR